MHLSVDPSSKEVTVCRHGRHPFQLSSGKDSKGNGLVEVVDGGVDGAGWWLGWGQRLGGGDGRWGGRVGEGVCGVGWGGVGCGVGVVGVRRCGMEKGDFC